MSRKAAAFVAGFLDALNGLGDKITALPLALSDKTGLTHLLLKDMTAGSALNTWLDR